MAETPIPQEKVSASRCARGKRRTIPKRPLKNPPGYGTPCWLPLSLQPRSKHNSPFTQEVTDSFQMAFYIPSSLSDVLVGFSLLLLPSNYQKLSRERRVRCGSSASLPAGSRGAAEEYVPPDGDALLARSLPVPRLAMAAKAAAACASPRRAAGAGKGHRGGRRRNADLSAPPADLELTSGGCRVRQRKKRAGCAWLPQEVPDLAPLPLLKCSHSFSLPPSLPLSCKLCS